ncbi:zinc finger protein 728 [Scaptodrosophila lebanonensis]|uniref:Zinc finger protein 728 n=1 Tax=Drosophila lebanonensis TaxID=7225 RepID=A0A6J2TA75_DROLE|nr:zinc finger protein 728 [Scaptodrosophila lebanonensis]
MRGELGPNICRVCLEPSKRLQRIDETREEGEETPNEMLIQLLGISFSKLNGKDQIPDGICKPCKVELNMAFHFREKALRKQAEIEEYFRSLGLLDEQEEEEEIYVKEEDDTNSQSMEPDQDEDDEMTEFMLEEVAVGEGDIIVDAGASKGNEEFVEIDTSDQHEILSGDIEYLESAYLELEGESEEALTNAGDSDPGKPMPPQRKQLALKPQLRRGRPRTGFSAVGVDGEKGGYICDVCGNFYEKRGRMMEHRRRHDAVCQYQCELCHAKFQVREQLRKHMYSHTGSKPYKCSFCSRQFFYVSVLKAHENVHRGVKPYVCKVCDKAFAYAHSLTKHELIHTDIKLYHCEYCNKDFRLLHHMRQHEETKCHQNAVMLHETMKYGRDEQQVDLIGVDDLKEDNRSENF